MALGRKRMTPLRSLCRGGSLFSIKREKKSGRDAGDIRNAWIITKLHIVGVGR